MITAIHHVSYTVSDLDVSLPFYTQALGFAPYSDRVLEGPMLDTVVGLEHARARIVHLRGHGLGLELFQYFSPPGAPTARRVCDAGSSHLCFIVDDIDHEARRLADAGARFVSPPQTVEAGPNKGNRFCYFLDPDGIPMELTQPARPTS